MHVSSDAWCFLRENESKSGEEIKKEQNCKATDIIKHKAFALSSFQEAFLPFISNKDLFKTGCECLHTFRFFNVCDICSGLKI